MRRHVSIALCGLFLATTGCTAGPLTSSGAPPVPGRLDPSTASTLAPRPLSLIPESLRISLPATNAAPTKGSFDVDLVDAASAPTVEAAPVKRGLLLAQKSLDWANVDSAIAPGQPYLLTPGEEWRQFDLQRYGFKTPVYGELSAALSPNGRHVALAAPHRLVTLDLKDNSFQRHDVPVSEAVGLEWSTDATTLFLQDRRDQNGLCGPQGCALDVNTGTLTPVPYNLTYSTQGAAGQAFEVKGATRSRAAQVLTHRPGAAPTVSGIAYRTTPSTAGGPVAARHLAFAQCADDSRRAVDEGGIVVVDPSTGQVTGMLGNKPGRRWCHLGAEAWLTDSHLMLSDWMTGDVWLWDVPTRRVVLVSRSSTNGQYVKVARRVMARRFSGLVRD